MPAKRYRVNLTQDEREQLLDVARRGKSPARKVKRSLILCKADEGLTDQQIADALLVSPLRWSVYASASWKKVWRGPSMSGRGLARSANLMGGKKPTWWQLHALLPPKGAPAGPCNCWLTRW